MKPALTYPKTYSYRSMGTKRNSSKCNWKWFQIILQKYHPDFTWGKCLLRNQSNRNLNILMMERVHTINLKPCSVGYIQKVTQTMAVTRNRRSSRLNQMEKSSLQSVLSHIWKTYKFVLVPSWFRITFPATSISTYPHSSPILSMQQNRNIP